MQIVAAVAPNKEKASLHQFVSISWFHFSLHLYLLCLLISATVTIQTHRMTPMPAVNQEVGLPAQVTTITHLQAL